MVIITKSSDVCKRRGREGLGTYSQEEGRWDRLYHGGEEGGEEGGGERCGCWDLIATGVRAPSWEETTSRVQPST